METRRVTLPATDEGVQRALDALAALFSEHGLSRAVTWPVDVSLDEVLANVVHHALTGRPEASFEVELALDTVARPPACEVRVVDDGPGFDPLGAAEPDTSLGLEQRPIGGLGISLVRRLMDEVSYERRDGRNHLLLRRRLVPLEAEEEGC